MAGGAASTGVAIASHIADVFATALNRLFDFAFGDTKTVTEVAAGAGGLITLRSHRGSGRRHGRIYRAGYKKSAGHHKLRLNLI